MTARTQRRKYNPLQRLIQDHMDRTGETYADIAARAGCPRQTVSALMNRDNYRTVPQAHTLAALARGLLVSEAMVRRAAAESIAIDDGLTVSSSQGEQLARLVEELPEAQVMVLLETARTMRRLNGAAVPNGRRK